MTPPPCQDRVHCILDSFTNVLTPNLSFANTSPPFPHKEKLRGRMTVSQGLRVSCTYSVHRGICALPTLVSCSPDCPPGKGPPISKGMRPSQATAPISFRRSHAESESSIWIYQVGSSGQVADLQWPVADDREKVPNTTEGTGSHKSKAFCSGGGPLSASILNPDTATHRISNSSWVSGLNLLSFINSFLRTLVIHNG